MKTSKLNPVARNLVIFVMAIAVIALLIAVAFFGSAVVNWIKGISISHVLTALISSAITAVVCGIVEIRISAKKDNREDGRKDPEEHDAPRERRRGER